MARPAVDPGYTTTTVGPARDQARALVAADADPSAQVLHTAGAVRLLPPYGERWTC